MRLRRIKLRDPNREFQGGSLRAADGQRLPEAFLGGADGQCERWIVSRQRRCEEHGRVARLGDVEAGMNSSSTSSTRLVLRTDWIDFQSSTVGTSTRHRSSEAISVATEASGRAPHGIHNTFRNCCRVPRANSCARLVEAVAVPEPSTSVSQRIASSCLWSASQGRCASKKGSGSRTGERPIAQLSRVRSAGRESWLSQRTQKVLRSSNEGTAHGRIKNGSDGWTPGLGNVLEQAAPQGPGRGGRYGVR